MKSPSRSPIESWYAERTPMANTNGSRATKIPRWMRLLAEKWRIADQAAAYPHAVPKKPAKPVPDAATDEHAPPRNELAASSGLN
jgi:hypothetical protein